MRFAILIMLSFIIVLLASWPSNAWEEGVDQDQLLDCEGLPLAGADKIVVRVRPAGGSFGLPKLVGLKDSKVLWTFDFPKAEEVNVAKLVVTCKGKRIRLLFSYPASRDWIIQDFSWNGKTIKRLRGTVVYR